MKTVVKMFQPRFIPLVEAGTKRQTVRPEPKGLRDQDWPEVGDLFSGRQWIGEPYRSKQRKLAEGLIYRVEVIRITFRNGGPVIKLGARFLERAEAERFARADGFCDLDDLIRWFGDRIPFKGLAIFWRPQTTDKKVT